MVETQADVPEHRLAVRLAKGHGKSGVVEILLGVGIDGRMRIRPAEVGAKGRRATVPVVPGVHAAPEHRAIGIALETGVGLRHATGRLLEYRIAPECVVLLNVSEARFDKGTVGDV